MLSLSELDPQHSIIEPKASLMCVLQTMLICLNFLVHAPQSPYTKGQFDGKAVSMVVRFICIVMMLGNRIEKRIEATLNIVCIWCHHK